jgi:hypothetical protein
MTALVALLLILALAAGVGRRVLALIGVKPQARIDVLVYSTSLGLGVIAYLVLALGMAGLLTKWAVLAGMAVLGALCCRGFAMLLTELRARPVEARTDRALMFATTAVFVAIGLIVVINCFVPPGAHEWDALAYHLAAPKVYVESHRIVYLPTDHHSNFPFLLEMLFTVGLLYDGYALANLFHFATGVLCVAAIVAIGRRHVSLAAGLLGGLVFATAPIVLWEAGAAYIELGLALFVILLSCRSAQHWSGA